MVIVPLTAPIALLLVFAGTLRCLDADKLAAGICAQVALNVEGRKDRAGARLVRRAFPDEPLQCFPCALKLGDPCIQSVDAVPRQAPCSLPVLARVEIEELLYLLQREASRLRLPYEQQPSNVAVTIAAHPH